MQKERKKYLHDLEWDAIYIKKKRRKFVFILLLVHAAYIIVLAIIDFVTKMQRAAKYKLKFLKNERKRNKQQKQLLIFILFPGIKDSKW